MAGTLTFAPAVETTTYRRPVRKITFSWTSDASGDVNGTASPIITGTIVRVTFNPGSAAPTADYDVVLNDEDGYDVLAGQGANRHTTTTESLCPGIAFKDGTTTSIAPIVVDGTLTLVITNAGNAKNGTVVLYVR